MSKKNKIISVILFLIGYSTPFIYMITNSEELVPYLEGIFLSSTAILFYFLIAKNSNKDQRVWAWAGLGAVIVIIMGAAIIVNIRTNKERILQERQVEGNIK